MNTLHIIFVLAILVLLYYLYSKTRESFFDFSGDTQKDNNCKAMTEVLIDNPAFQTSLTSINPSLKEFQYLLRDYYIKSSYNSCAGGDNLHDYVGLCPLKLVLRQGCRMVDFGVYMINGKASVAVSNTNDYNFKGSRNSLPIEEVFDTVSRYGFSSPCPNPRDPLLIHLRIKSNHTDIYTQLTKYVKKYFGSKLLDNQYGYEYYGKNLGTVPLNTLMGKVIIICDNTNQNFRGTEFEELVNMTSTSPFCKNLQNYDVQYTHNGDELTDFNKKNMSLSHPDLTSIPKNMPYVLHKSYGIQMICMNFQKPDNNLQGYIEFYNEAGYAFALKPKQLRYVPIVIKSPPPQNPELSYAPRTIQKPYFKAQI